MNRKKAEPIPPLSVDLEFPSVARVYDYLLGGDANWAIDREFAKQLLAKLPIIQDIAIANRMFLNRVVAYLTQRGVRQFLDIGAGVPTAGNTHQVADHLVDGVRVVYVDNEPVAVEHAEALLDKEGDPNRHAVIAADLRDPDELWSRAMDTGLLDPHEPIALLMIAVLHVAQPGQDGADLGAQSVARFRELLSPGSYLALSHLTTDGVPEDIRPKLVQVTEMYGQSSSPAILRDRAEIGALMGDFRLIEPGMTWTPLWHPQEQTECAQNIELREPSQAAVWVGVGQKPA